MECLLHGDRIIVDYFECLEYFDSMPPVLARRQFHFPVYGNSSGHLSDDPFHGLVSAKFFIKLFGVKTFDYTIVEYTNYYAMLHMYYSSG